MASASAPAPLPPAATQTLRPEIEQIIQAGRQSRAAFASVSVKPVLAVSMFTALLLWLSFTPVDAAPVAWIALVPLCLILRMPLLPKYSYLALTISGLVWSIATLQWMRLGHWTMHGALAAMAFYLSLYFPVFVAVSRSLIRRRWPLWLVVPLAWTSLEYLRAWLFTGFSWYYLGHTQYQWTSLVQVADLTGAYGISFLIAMLSGGLAQLVSPGIIAKLGLVCSQQEILPQTVRQQTAGILVPLILVAASCVYGFVRMQPVQAGQNDPVVAVVQGNFTPELKHDPDQWRKMVNDHDLLTRRAAGLRPDLIVWPETMFPVPNQIVDPELSDEQLIGVLPLPGRATNSDLVRQEIERWRSEYARELLINRSQEAGAAMLVGMITEVASSDRIRRYNSAAFIRPDLGYVDRYDKAHRVIFGEYIPLRSVFPWLAKLTPFGAGFGIDAGDRPAVFGYQGVQYAPIICFEDTVPGLVRDAVRFRNSDGQQADVLINMTNDGWFRGSSELDQHLITATFRCIENRRPMVRAVNAGISAFIDSSGRIRQPQHFLLMDESSAGVIADFEPVDTLIDPATGKRWRQCSAVMCGQLPLDGRSSLYLKFGDWFAVLCSLCTIVGVVVDRFQRRRSSAQPSLT